MAYTALYRKFRPTTFGEMVGQEHIIKTLKNQLISGRVGHAYLFNGGRGTGKTTSAKVFARAINCLNPKDGEPCNECEICKAALSGSLTDIVEMDAASNNSVEDIRSIREEVNFLPTLAKYRVYIIDEFHMLSPGAFNALLKTLEEPPEHVKFILATTDPQRIPATILSRCQRFDFKTIPTSDIISRLQVICNKSNITITPGALKTIAVLAEGGMRDAISILERCIQDGEKEINEDKVKDLVGIPKLEYINRLVNNIISSNATDALLTIDEVLKEGKDIDNFLLEVIKYFKDILVFQTCNNLELYNESELDQIKQISNKVSKEKLLRLICDLSDLANSLKWSTQKQIVFQTGIIKACVEQTSLEERIKNIEDKLQNGDFSNVAQSAPSRKVEVQGVPQRKEETPSATKKATPKVTIPGEALSYWPSIVNKLKEQGKVMLYTNLMNTVAKQINDMTVGIEFPNGLTSFGKTVLEKPENMQELVKLISIESGKEMRIKLIDLKAANESASKGEATGLESLGIKINIIE